MASDVQLFQMPQGFAEHRSTLPFILAITCIVMGGLGCAITSSVLLVLGKRRWSTLNIDVRITYLVLILDFLGSFGTFLVGICSLTPMNLWIRYNWLCDVNAFFLVGFFYASNYTVAMMSFQRYLLTVHNKRLQDLVWYVIGLIIIVLCVGNITLLIVFNLVELMPLTIYCLTSPETNIGYAAVVIYCTCGTLSWIIIVYCYVSIAVYRRVQDIKLAKSMNMNLEFVQKRSNKILFRALLIILVYILANSLEVYNMISELITHTSRSLLMGFISCSLMNINCICNGLLLLWMNSQVKKDFKKYFNLK